MSKESGERRLINTERAQAGWRFWLWWVLASTAGLLVGLVVVAYVGYPYAAGPSSKNSEAFVVVFALAGAIVGASLGIAQWLVLRRRVSRTGWWMLASTAGGLVGFAFDGMVLRIMFAAPEGDLAFAALIGASLGIAQWLVLRRRVSRAGWWVLASTVGSVVFLASVVFSAGAVLTSTSRVAVLVGIVALVVSWAVYGAITGGVLVWLLRQPIATELGPSQAAA